MKNKLDDLIEYLNDIYIKDCSLSRQAAYLVIKEFVSEMCENQKAECYTNAELEDDGVEWDDNGYQVNWIVKESSIMECKNVADEL